MPDSPRTTTRHVTRLDDPRARDRSIAGGKAGALADLAATGLPIVPGFVIHPDAPLDGRRDGLRHELATALADTGAEAFAVRSSATAEDLEDASFAGVYDSFLNVRGVDEVIARAADVRASLTSERAVAYARRVGLDPEEQRMSVLVQPLLDSSAAGVAFTLDPLTGASDRIVINAAFGLGEGVVAGSGGVDHFVTSAEADMILERSIATKRTRVIPAAGGGIATVEVPPDDADLAVAALARRVKQTVGDRDIEFAVLDGVAHLLQARPITGLDASDDDAPEFPVEWDDPEDEKYVWRLVSRAPEPLFQRRARDRYDQHSARVFEDTGVPMARMHVSRYVNGYRYARPVEADPKEVGARQARHVARNAELRRQGGSVWLSEVEPRTIEIWQRLNRFAQLSRRDDIEQRLAHLEAALEAFGFVMGDLHWRMAGASNFDWPSTYEELTGEPAVDSGILLQALDNRTTRLIRRLRGLAGIAQSDAALARAIKAQDYAPILEARADGALSSEEVRRFRARFRRLLADLVHGFAAQDLDALEDQERTARAQRVAAERRLRRRFASDAERLARFEDALAQARAGNDAMENHNFYMEQGVLGALREAIYLVGESLAARGQLDEPTHLNHLEPDEVRAAVADASFDVRPLVAERRTELAQYRQLRPPMTLGDGDPLPDFGPPAPERELVGLHGTSLHGTPASRGEHVGVARIVAPGAPPPAIEAGEILVGVNAGPDWTPAMPLLGAIVLDEGAVFQHICLVAREYRVPCVIQTKEATKVIHEGQRLRVDGQDGIVELNPGG
jgi:phosphohistidine swiveling domain-containing protein